MITAVSADYVPRTPPEHRRTPRPLRPPQWVFWVRRIVALALLALLLWGLVRCTKLIDGSAEPTETPPAPETEVVVTTERREAQSSIPTSRPVEMMVPVLGLRADFEEADCRVVDGALDPKTMDKACAYTADDKPYSLPGTDAEDIVVVAGHTAAGVNAVFNELYDGSREEHRVHTGDSLYLRTETSGDDWLKYTATDLHDPEKTALSDDPEIWGTGPTPGRLLTISCIQPANLLADSVKNAVVGWQFAGTVTGEEVRTAFEPR